MDAESITGRLALLLSSDSGEPAAHRIADDLWLAVVEGALATGARFPTVRELAVALRVSPRSVERAYEELERRGVASTRPGEGTFVSLEPPSGAALARHREFLALCRETVAHAEKLGFGLDELLDALAEFRTADHSLPTEE